MDKSSNKFSDEWQKRPKWVRAFIFTFLILAALSTIYRVARFFMPPKPVGPSVEEIVTELLELDKNKDGQITKDEVSERMQGIFDRGDENKDGILTKDELRKMAQKQYDATQQNQRDKKREAENP